MKFMVFVPATKESEAGQLPTAEMIKEMTKYNEELVKAGVMLDGQGLHPSSKGARVVFEPGKEPAVIDGPFTESKELVAGYWIWKCKSRDEAIAWLKKAPFAKVHGWRTAIELRQIFDVDDFAPVDPTGELRKKEEELFAQAAKNK